MPIFSNNHSQLSSSFATATNFTNALCQNARYRVRYSIETTKTVYFKLCAKEAIDLQ